MKILGHVYVANRAVKSSNPTLLTFGSILPEMVFYIPENPFSFEEIHEGGDRLLNFLSKKYPDYTDLALGILCHSVKYGVDYFDKLNQLKHLGYTPGKDNKFEQLLKSSLNLPDLKTAQVRAHNILDLALDKYISQNYLWVQKELNVSLKIAPVEKIADILSSCFNKNKVKTSVAIKHLTEIISLNKLNTLNGLTQLWANFSQALPEKNIDLDKTQKVIAKCMEMINGKEEIFLEKVIRKVRNNLTEFI